MKTIPTASAAVDGPASRRRQRWSVRSGGWRTRSSAVRLLAASVGVVVVATLLGATVGGGVAVAASTQLKVVAAENFWGSIVKQLAGSKASVSSIITNPDTDPHSYEAKPSDARAIASARYVIENGIGYDPWAQKLLDADPDQSRKVLNVGDLVGVKEGGNPHQWYSVHSVQAFVDRVTADLKSLDPKNSTYYEKAKAAFETKGLAQYNALIAEIKQKYAGTPVGASESIFTPLAQTLGLKLSLPRASSTRSQRGPIRPRRIKRRSTARSRTSRSRCSCSTARTRRRMCRQSSRQPKLRGYRSRP